MNYCRRFYIFHRFHSAGKLHRVFSKELPYSLSKPLVKLQSHSFLGTLVLAANVVKCVSEAEEPLIEEPPSDYVKSRLEQSCLHSVSEISSLIEEVSVAVTNCSIQYKNSLNELITSFETYKSLGEYSVLREECEQAMIIARANVTDCKKEFLDLITIFESIRKVASAVAELSFLIASESSALKLFEGVDALQVQVNEEMEEIKQLENKCLSVEKSMIESTKF